MTATNASFAQSRRAGKEDARGAGEIDSAAFSLRDTLSGIIVREANFSEFLAALKQCGRQVAKSN